jgi:hypothetical protein
MTYFDLFVTASWMFVIGWFSAAIYFQNQNEKAESPRLSEGPETWPNLEAPQLSAAAVAVAAD